MKVQRLNDSEKQPCEAILRSLPQWFGIEDALVQFVADVRDMDTWGALRDGELVGFVTVKQHFENAAEVHVMGVRPDFHRQGVGRTLLNEAERTCRDRGVYWMQVKTLGPSHPDEYYARTRAFYAAMGYEPIEESDSRWPGNPCLQMMKRLDAQKR